MTSYTSVWAAIQKLLCLWASQHFKAYAETQVLMGKEERPLSVSVICRVRLCVCRVYRYV